MSGLAWKLRRLNAMTPGEVLHRTRIALRDRLAPRAYEMWTPPEAGEKLFGGRPDDALKTSRLPQLTNAPPGDTGFERVIAAADALAQSKWPLFGRVVQLDDPPDWNRNYVSGDTWPDLSSHKLDYRRADVAGGVKMTWELGRLTMLPTLALATRQSGNVAHADRAIRWLTDWNERNPLGHGIHFTSGIELAVRVLTVTWTLALLGKRAGEADPAATLGLTAQQALHCRDHLSLGSSANNHLLSEYAAMAVAAVTFPTMRGAAGMWNDGIDGLETEVLRQIHPDGVPAEQAFGYLPFIWELLLLPFIASEAAGRPVDDDVRARLFASLEFARRLRLPEGRLPSIGDEDDARVLLAEIDAPRLDLTGNLLAAWLGTRGLSGGDDELVRTLLGREGPLSAAAPDGRHVFEHGGCTVWRQDGLLVTFDHGPLGYTSLAAHGHADALSVTMHLDGVPIVVDPGTLAYHADRDARDRCRSTPVHATVHFGGRSQSEMLGPFMWGRRAIVEPYDGGFECRWYTGETHARRVDVLGDGVEIRDRVRGKSAVLVFPLGSDSTVECNGVRAVVRAGGVRASFDALDGGRWRAEEADVAPRFGVVKRAPRLAMDVEGETARTRISVDRVS